MSTDPHGQPIETANNASRRVTRAIHELIGFMRGIIADDHINEREAERLAHWVLANKEAVEHWPVNVLANRLNRIYADHQADEEERAELAELVKEVIGQADIDEMSFSPASLPLTKPAPEVIFDMNEFVFTGRFMFGTRKQCEREVELRGGKCGGNVRLQTNYLVVGALMSRDWKFSSFGTKILKAVDYQQHCGIQIIAEQHWHSFLEGNAMTANP
jgi:NAD-dependent DNA ligase